LALSQGALSRAAAYQGFLQFIRKGERDRLQQYGAEPINRPSWMRPCQLDTALLPSLAITAESLLGPANGSLGLKPSGRLSLSISLRDLRYTKPKFLNDAGDKRALQWHILAGWRSRHKERRRLEIHGRRRF
jgi:hypothetical protein